MANADKDCIFHNHKLVIAARAYNTTILKSSFMHLIVPYLLSQLS